MINRRILTGSLRPVKPAYASRRLQPGRVLYRITDNELITRISHSDMKGRTHEILS
jgi:hypothetical protein